MLRQARTLTIGMLAVALTLPTLAAAADTGDEYIPLTDPALLARLGYEPDAHNVYATPQAYQQLLMNPAERAALQETLAMQRRSALQAAPAEELFGDMTAGFSPVWASEFRHLRENTESRLTLPGFGLSCSSGFPTLLAQVQDVPHGAELEWIDVWFRDESSDDDLSVWLTKVCQPDFSADGIPETVVLGSFESLGTAGYAFAGITVDDDVDLQSCAYYISVAFEDDIPLIECTAGDDLSVLKTRVQWRRQVSPAPASASFGDVPTDHPFFPYVEALAASGITGGCGDGDFCPNNPLTRGQMAVFLAKALGLHWGQF